VFSSAAFHIKVRDRWLHWTPHQLKEQRHLIAQNARFLVLASTYKWPNLASRVLSKFGPRSCRLLWPTRKLLSRPPVRCPPTPRRWA
jgi:hypothetical protein